MNHVDLMVNCPARCH